MKKIFIIISAVLIIAGIASVCFLGVNRGFDSSAATIYTVDLGDEFTVADVEAIVKAAGISDFAVQAQDALNANTGKYQRQTSAVVKFIMPEGQTMEKLKEKLDSDLTVKYNLRGASSIAAVGGGIDKAAVIKATWSTAVAGALVLVYMAIRFSVKTSLCSLALLAHNAVISIGLYSVLGIEMNRSIIAAVLLVLALTFVTVFPMAVRLRKKSKHNIVADGAVLALALVAVAVLFFVGPANLKPFALAGIIGVVVCAYSALLVVPAFEKSAEK